MLHALLTSTPDAVEWQAALIGLLASGAASLGFWASS
jgi:hypothetical protein